MPRYLMSLMRIPHPRLVVVLPMLASPWVRVMVASRQLLMVMRTRGLCVSNVAVPQLLGNGLRGVAVMDCHQSRLLRCLSLPRLLRKGKNLGCCVAWALHQLGAYFFFLE